MKLEMQGFESFARRLSAGGSVRAVCRRTPAYFPKFVAVPKELYQEVQGVEWVELNYQESPMSCVTHTRIRLVEVDN